MSYQKFIAKAPIGKEFIYSKSSAMYVSKASANEICEQLNKIRYNLKDGEIWHIYDAEGYEDYFILDVIKKYKNRIYNLVKINTSVLMWYVKNPNRRPKSKRPFFC